MSLPRSPYDKELMERFWKKLANAVGEEQARLVDEIEKMVKCDEVKIPNDGKGLVCELVAPLASFKEKLEDLEFVEDILKKAHYRERMGQMEKKL